MNIFMDNEYENNLTIIESFINYCKINEPDKMFVGRLAQQIKLYYSDLNETKEDNDENIKYNFSDIEFIDNLSDDSKESDNDSLYNNLNSEPEPELEKVEYSKTISNDAKRRLDSFLKLNFDSQKIHLYNKNKKVLESLNIFIDQSDYYD